MATTLREGVRTWGGSRDEKGHREYLVRFIVQSDFEDGPANVLRTPGLPQPGSQWAFAQDVDLWAWCTWKAKVAILEEREGERARFWTVDLTFTTKPFDQCCDDAREDPLLEPMKVSGTFVKYKEEAAYDLKGNPMMNSAWEPLRGPLVEFDANYPTVRIEQNVPLLGLDVFTSMVDGVNATPLWGLPARCIKLSNVTWERKYHGLCNIYYTRVLEFDINLKTFDRTALDEGTKALNGKWTRNGTNGALKWELQPIDDLGSLPDPTNPAHFKRYRDPDGELTRVILNGAGEPHNPVPLPKTLDCTPCNPGKAPLYWRMLGVNLVNNEVNPFVPVGADPDEFVTIPVLKFTGMEGTRCVWGPINATVSSAFGDFSLTISQLASGALYAKLFITRQNVQILGQPEQVYTEWQIMQQPFQPPKVWNCSGPNVVLMDFQHSGFIMPNLVDRIYDPLMPYAIMLVPYNPDAVAPGVHYLQKYQSVDLLLLGIPTTF